MGFKEFFKPYCIGGVDQKKQYGRFLAGNLMAGGLSGMATFTVIYPLDFTRTRLAIDMGKSTSFLLRYIDFYSKSFRSWFSNLEFHHV